MKLPSAPRQYDPAYFERILNQLTTELVDLRKQLQVAKSQSVAQANAANLKVGDLQYVLDGNQNCELILKADDGRIYRFGALAAETTSSVSTPFVTPAATPFVVVAGEPRSAGLSAERDLTGTSNQIIITDNGANSTIVLSTPQNIHTAATPTFAGVVISSVTSGNVLSSNGTTFVGVTPDSAGLVAKSGNQTGIAGNKTWTGTQTFQNAADSTTGFQVLDADGGTPILNVDTTNERVGVGTAAPSAPLDVVGTLELNGNLQQTGSVGLHGATPAAQNTGWSVSNVTTTKTYDADSLTLDTLADVVGTLIENFLKVRGDLGA